MIRRFPYRIPACIAAVSAPVLRASDQGWFVRLLGNSNFYFYINKLWMSRQLCGRRGVAGWCDPDQPETRRGANTRHSPPAFHQ
jgi:hypothetical protein